ncbi:MAG TPA: hypothetical protein VFI23_16805, partial [Rhizomicrobium sp.]|nr:hypothetical protein [Rhizomicrobium sp.]
ADFGGYKGAPPPPYVVVPLWNGFYAGVNGGGGESASNGFLSPSGGFGGGQIGYNWQGIWYPNLVLSLQLHLADLSQPCA